MERTSKKRHFQDGERCSCFSWVTSKATEVIMQLQIQATSWKIKNLHAKQIDGRGLHAQEDPFLSETSTSEFCEAARSIYGKIMFVNEENYAQPPGFHTKSFWN